MQKYKNITKEKNLNNIFLIKKEETDVPPSLLSDVTAKAKIKNVGEEKDGVGNDVEKH